MPLLHDLGEPGHDQLQVHLLALSGLAGVELVAFSAPLEALRGGKPGTLPGAVHLEVARAVTPGLEGLGLVPARRQGGRRR